MERGDRTGVGEAEAAGEDLGGDAFWFTIMEIENG